MSPCPMSLYSDIRSTQLCIHASLRSAAARVPPPSLNAPRACLQVLPDEPPAKVPRTTGDIVLALCALQETQLSRDNVGPLPDKSHETHHRVYERLFEYGDKLVFCEAICAVYDGMRLGSTLMEFIELLYGEAYRFAGAALRTTISPYGFYLKKGFRPHVFSMGYTYYPPLLENGQCEYQCEHLLVSRADSEDHSYLMMKRFF